MRILIQKQYEPGDLPPENGSYLDWHEWAEVQYRAGIKQKQCGNCGEWKTPQELTDQEHEFNAKDNYGKSVKIISHLCKKCVSNALVTGAGHDD